MSFIDQRTKLLHEKILRLLKGVLSAWEEWLKES
jgi:hypothetical protein